MSVVLVPFRTQHGVRSKIVLLAYSCWDQISRRNGLNTQIDRSNCTRILHMWFQTRWWKVCHLPDCRYRWKFRREIPLIHGGNGNKNLNLPQGNWSCKETWWNGSGTAIKPHQRRAVFGNLLKFHLLTRAWRPRWGRRQTSSRKSCQLRDRYGKVWWILSKTRPSTHAAREILDSP